MQPRDTIGFIYLSMRVARLSRGLVPDGLRTYFCNTRLGFSNNNNSNNDKTRWLRSLKFRSLNVDEAGGDLTQLKRITSDTNTPDSSLKTKIDYQPQGR